MRKYLSTKYEYWNQKNGKKFQPEQITEAKRTNSIWYVSIKTG